MLGLAIGAGQSYGTIHSIASRLNLMQKTIGEIEHSSDYSKRAPIASRGELGQTAKSFNQLMGVLQWETEEQKASTCTKASTAPSTWCTTSSNTTPKWSRNTATSPRPVECLAHQLNQVFMNILVNASHAIGPDGHGRITIRSGTKDDKVWVEISDNGKGIAPENLKRIFDPFFTTKPVGKGTGLGLSLSYGIVEKRHGKIEVESEVGKGTTFRVWLPVRQSAA